VRKTIVATGGGDFVAKKNHRYNGCESGRKEILSVVFADVLWIFAISCDTITKVLLAWQAMRLINFPPPPMIFGDSL